MPAFPGFTAAASAYADAGYYRARVQGSPLPGGIVPQLRKSIGFCMADCDFTETNPVSNAACKFDCLGGGDDGPGGPEDPGCRPGCGPCVDGVKTCVRADCETYERTCRSPRVRRTTLAFA